MDNELGTPSGLCSPCMRGSEAAAMVIGTMELSSPVYAGRWAAAVVVGGVCQGVAIRNGRLWACRWGLWGSGTSLRL